LINELPTHCMEYNAKEIQIIRYEQKGHKFGISKKTVKWNKMHSLDRRSHGGTVVKLNNKEPRTNFARPAIANDDMEFDVPYSVDKHKRWELIDQLSSIQETQTAEMAKLTKEGLLQTDKQKFINFMKKKNELKRTKNNKHNKNKREYRKNKNNTSENNNEKDDKNIKFNDDEIENGEVKILVHTEDRVASLRKPSFVTLSPNIWKYDESVLHNAERELDRTKPEKSVVKDNSGHKWRERRKPGKKGVKPAEVFPRDPKTLYCLSCIVNYVYVVIRTPSKLQWPMYCVSKSKLQSRFFSARRKRQRRKIVGEFIREDIVNPSLTLC